MKQNYFFKLEIIASNHSYTISLKEKHTIYNIFHRTKLCHWYSMFLQFVCHGSSLTQY